LSLAITWPPGYIRTPQFESLRHDGWVLGAPALLFLYYLIAWLSIGSEQKPGVMIARYEPPAGLSPAAARFIASGTRMAARSPPSLRSLRFADASAWKPRTGNISCRGS